VRGYAGASVIAASTERLDDPAMIIHARWLYSLAAFAICGLSGTQARAETLSGSALVKALRQGGYVLVMRHPSSPQTAPDPRTADPGNTQLDRQLDDTGRRTAREMGDAFRSLRIPLGAVLSSPTYRAMEAVRLAGLKGAKSVPELGEGAQGMMANADAERSAWLRKKVAEAPRPGTNTLLVTHTPNLMGAFGQKAAGIAAGEALVFRPNGTSEPELVARIKIEEWPKLAGGP
jgi:phosphohistidine phosphatase SixA